MEKEKWLEYLEIADTTLEEVSSIAVQQVMQMLSDCLEYTSKSNGLSALDCTTLCLKLKEMQDLVRNLSWCIEEMTANGSSSSHLETGSNSTESQGCPTHYQKQGFRSIDFIDKVLDDIDARYDLSSKQVYSIKDFLKYTIRAGEKDPWEKDAFKTADYIVRCITDGTFLNEMPLKEERND